MDENKCFRGKFSQNLFSYDDLNYFYCDISVENILVDNLSGIKFYSKVFDYTFELTKDELYYKNGKYIYLTILYFDHLYNDWIVGQMFTSKYHFVFNTDSREIGFYKKVNIAINNENDGHNLLNGGSPTKIWTIIISISFVLLGIGIFIGIFIGIKFLKKSKNILVKELMNEVNTNKTNKLNRVQSKGAQSIIIKNKDRAKIRQAITVNRKDSPKNKRNLNKLFKSNMKKVNTLNEILTDGNRSTVFNKKETNKI